MSKILIIGPAWVGDMVMAQALFQLLKSRDSGVVIDVVAPDWTHALLACMPEVRRAISLPIRHKQLGLSIRYSLGKQLRDEHYDQAIVLPNSWKSALLPFFARVPKRTGFRGEWRYGLLNDVRILDEKKYPLMVERFLSLGVGAKENISKKYSLPKLSVDAARSQKTLQTYQLTKNKNILVLCPGAEYGPAKCWLPEHFAFVANHYLEKNWQICILGSKNDMKTSEKISQQTFNRCMNLTGKTNLLEAIDLLSLANGVVTNDSGLMHVACALNLPVIAIYGSSSPGFTPPLGKRVKILSLNLSCSPCFERECPYHHLQCLRDLKPEKVIEEAKELLVS